MQLDKLRGKELDQLFTAIMKMDSLEDCYTLFEDLATVNEIQALAQRLKSHVNYVKAIRITKSKRRPVLQLQRSRVSNAA